MRVLSGIQPTGMAHIGNYYGAIANWVREQELGETFYCVVDLHALTVEVDPKELEKGMKQSEAIIFSMTVKERRNPDILNASRRRRIAAGSGVEVQDVNKLVKQFREAQKLMKTLQKTGGRGLGNLFG